MQNVYIILSQTGTIFSRIIRFFTKDPYNHASISFTHDLKVMYSFGRKSRYNLLHNGFVKENFKRGIYACFPYSCCCVLEIQVRDDEYNRMKTRIEAFCCNEERYRFNLLGVLGNIFGADIGRKNHFFCSQFVSHIMGCTESWNKEPLLTKPMDLYYIPGRRVVYEGYICGYCEAEMLLLHGKSAAKSISR